MLPKSFRVFLTTKEKDEATGQVVLNYHQISGVHASMEEANQALQTHYRAHGGFHHLLADEGYTGVAYRWSE